jgi:hypothetical protein
MLWGLQSAGSGGGGGRAVSVCCLMPGMSYAPVGLTPLPLGSILVVPQGDRDLPSLAEAFQRWRISPWCPGVLLSSRPISQELLDAVRPPAMQLAVVEAIELPPVPVIHTKVRSRPSPDSTDLAAYVAVRGSMTCATLFLSALRTDRSAAALRRPLRQLGRWLPHDWRAIDSCVKAVADAISRGQNEAEAAHRARVDVKTLSGWCDRYFATDWRKLVRLEAWEAVLELAVRLGGYVRPS